MEMTLKLNNKILKIKLNKSCISFACSSTFASNFTSLLFVKESFFKYPSKVFKISNQFSNSNIVVEETF